MYAGAKAAELVRRVFANIFSRRPLECHAGGMAVKDVRGRHPSWSRGFTDYGSPYDNLVGVGKRQATGRNSVGARHCGYQGVSLDGLPTAGFCTQQMITADNSNS